MTAFGKKFTVFAKSVCPTQTSIRFATFADRVDEWQIEADGLRAHSTGTSDRAVTKPAFMSYVRLVDTALQEQGRDGGLLSWLSLGTTKDCDHFSTVGKSLRNEGWNDYLAEALRSNDMRCGGSQLVRSATAISSD
jgi:hypothetical protein